MAALTKRDIEMIFRAETDAAQRPVNELSSDVKRLRQTLEDLTKASGKTDKSLDSLAATTRELEQAQDELANARTLLTQLNAQANALERAETAAEKAAKKYSDLKTQVDEAEKPTKRLTTSMEAAERRMNAANGALDAQRKNYAEIKSEIEGLVGPVDSLQDAFREVAVAQRDVSQGLASAKGAVSEFKQEIASAATEAQRLRDIDAFKAEAREAGVSDSRINELVQEENRTRALAQAKKELAEQDRLFRAQADAQAETANVRFLEALNREKASMAALADQAERMEQVNAFRTLAADAVAVDSATDRIKAGLDGGTTSAQRLADSIRGLVDPARAASVTIDGMDEKLNRVLTGLEGGKLSVSEWGQFNNELENIQANLIRVSAEVDNFTQQQSRVDDAAAAYDRQAAKVRELGQAQITASSNIEEMTADLQREERALEQLGVALDRETNKLRGFGQALNRSGVDSSNLPAAIQRIEQTATRAAPAIDKVRNAITPGGKRGFLGLDAYQLQNLSYQVNDVFTGLASGQPIYQVFAQQSGQIVQIFPGIISGFVRWLPLIAPVAAALTVLTSAMIEANREIETLRTGTTVVASLGNLNGYNPQKFRTIVNNLRDLGASFEDATAMAKTFVEQGLNPESVNDFSTAILNLAESENVELKDATEEVVKAFTSGAEAVLTLDDKYKFLTETQRQNLIASKDTKNEYNEVNKAFTALYNKMQDGANAARGPMKTATDTLRQAWRDLLKTFNDTGALDAANDVLRRTILGFTFLINVARRTGQVMNAARKAFNAHQGQGDFVALMHAGAALAGAEAGLGGGVGEAAWRDTEKQYRQTQERLSREQDSAGVDAGAGSRERMKAREAAAEKARKEDEKQRKKDEKAAEAEAKRRKREAEQLEKQYQNEQDQLQATLSRFTVEAMKNTQAPLEQQLGLARDAVNEQFRVIEDRLQEFGAKFGKERLINGMSQSDFAEAIKRQKDQITLARQLGVYEQNVNDIIKGRDTALKAIQDDQKAGLINSDEALQRAAEVTSRFQTSINGAINPARAFIAALKPSAETTALLEKFDRFQSQGEKQSVVRGQAIMGVDENEKKINAVFERRAQLIAAANNLYESGVYNYTERENHIKEAYEATNKALSDLITEAQEYIDKYGEILPPHVLSNARAQLALFNSELQYTDELTQNVRDSARQALSDGIVNMFHSFASGIADLITGTKSLGDFFTNLGKTALQFAADFTMAIAQAIIQIYALRVAKSLIGSTGSPLGFLGLHGGGTAGSYANGRMTLSRNLVAADLSGVPRYHNGTASAGLKHNEMLAVLEEGERVQTEEQQRAEAKRLANAKNGSGRGLRQVLAFGDDEVAGAMAGPAGEDVVITHIRRNRPRIRQELGIK